MSITVEKFVENFVDTLFSLDVDGTKTKISIRMYYQQFKKLPLLIGKLLDNYYMYQDWNEGYFVDMNDPDTTAIIYREEGEFIEFCPKFSEILYRELDKPTKNSTDSAEQEQQQEEQQQQHDPIDEINFIDLPLLSNLEKDTADPNYYLPVKLEDCIAQAVESKNPDTIKHLIQTSSQHLDRLYMDPIIDSIYTWAFAEKYLPEEFDMLFRIIPIDINRPIHRLNEGFCRPPEKEISDLLHMTASWCNDDASKLLAHFIQLGANLKSKYSEETLGMYLRRRLKEYEARQPSPHPENEIFYRKQITLIQDMLAVLKAAEEKQGLEKEEELQVPEAEPVQVSAEKERQNPRANTPTPQPKKQSCLKNLGMQVLFGFMALIGSVAVALAFVLLNAAILNPIGITVAVLGTAVALAGMGLFAHSLCKNNKPEVIPQESPVNNNNCSR